MTLQAKKIRAYIVTAIGAISGGIWQHSIWAGIAMGTALLFLGGLVVAVQHTVSGGKWPEAEGK